jgi:hypothetical protein
MLDIPMTEIRLNAARIMPSIRKSKAAGMAKHVRMYPKPCQASSAQRSSILAKPAVDSGAALSETNRNGDAGEARFNARNALNSTPDNG